jgi:hypothetical protein
MTGEKSGLRSVLIPPTQVRLAVDNVAVDQGASSWRRPCCKVDRGRQAAIHGFALANVYDEEGRLIKPSA